MSPQEMGPKSLEQTIFDTKVQIHVLSNYPELVFDYENEFSVSVKVDELRISLGALEKLLPYHKPVLHVIENTDPSCDARSIVPNNFTPHPLAIDF